MVALGNLPAPSNRMEELLVQVSVLSNYAREKLKENVEAIRQESIRAEESHVESKAIVHVDCPNSERQRQLEALRQDGCISELFKLCKQTRELGWQRLLVADNKTKMQLEADPSSLWHWEKETEASVILIWLDSDSPLARRERLSKAIKIVCDVVEDRGASGRRLNYTSPYKLGMRLRDPDGSLFSDTTTSMSVDIAKVEDELATSASLPVEIMDMIKSYALSNLAVEDMTTIARPASAKTTMAIRAVAPADKNTLSSVGNEIQERHTALLGIDTKKWEIYPWKLSYPATRRHIYKLCERMMTDCSGERRNLRGITDVTYSVLWEPKLWADHREIISISFHHGEMTVRTIHIDVRLRVKILGDRWEKSRIELPSTPHGDLSHYQNVLMQAERMNQSNRMKETLQDPESRFFFDPPYWAAGGDRSLPSVWFLTKHLSDNEVTRIKTELIKNQPYPSDSDGIEDGSCYKFLPWSKEEDGTIEDIARIHSMRVKYKYKWDCPGQLICIDRQSAQDLTVVLTDNWTSEDGKLSLGMQYGRIPARYAGLAWESVHGRNSRLCESFQIGVISEIKDPYGIHTERDPGHG